MKAAVINYSFPAYNLAEHRIANWLREQGKEVVLSPGQADMWANECQEAYLSCIFTWNLPRLAQDARTFKQNGIKVEIGGPAATAMPDYIVEQTGIQPVFGLDPRFEHVPGEYETVFTSRGCPRGCSFCIVGRLEGRKIIEYDDFPVPVGVNPYISDNNILLTSWRHQQMVVERVKHVRNLDFNSGFDDRIFLHDPQKYWDLYSQTHLEAWRFAYDSPEQREPIKACVDFLHAQGVNYRNIIVFCLVGGPGQSFEECRERLQYLIDIGTSPYPQRYRPLNSLSHSWDPGWPNNMNPEILFGYYGVGAIWRSCTWQEYLEERTSSQKVLARLLDDWR